MRRTVISRGISRINSMFLLSAVLALSWSSLAHATVFWEETFNSSLNNGWSGFATPPNYPMPGAGIDNALGTIVSGTALSMYYCVPPNSNLTGLNCGTYMGKGFTPTHDLWVRWWVKSSPGFQVDSTGTKGPGIFCEPSPCTSFWMTNQFGSPFYRIDAQTSDGGVQVYYQNTAALANIDGQTHCVEMHFRYNGGDTLEQWIDGTQTMGHYGLNLLGNNNPMTSLRLYVQHGLGILAYDDVAVGTQRIGCTGSPVDTEPPTAVTNLVASPQSSTSVSLSWTAATDTLDPTPTHNIERCTGASCVSSFTAAGSTDSSSFLVTGLSASTTYGFRIRANDDAGNLGPYSSIVYATTNPSTSSQPILSITANGQYAINGTGAFLQGIGYYDCSNYHTTDIDALVADGFNLFVCHLDDVYRQDVNSLYNSDGTLKSAKVTAFQSFIDYVASKGALVDLYLMYADVDGVNTAAYITSLANQLAAITNAVNAFKVNTNVMIGVMNEHNYGSCCDSDTVDMPQYMAAARAACSGCLLHFSSSDNIGALGSGGHVYTTNQSTVVNPTTVQDELTAGTQSLVTHNDRWSGWNNRTTSRVSNLRAHLDSIGRQNVPVFLEEDGAENNVLTVTAAPLGSAAAYVQVAVDAKLAGAAGWVYTPDASFDLTPNSLLSQITAVEQSYMDTVASALANASVVVRDTALATDNFNRAGPGLGGNWTVGYTGQSDPVITGSVKVEAANLNAPESFATYNAVSWPANQWGKAILADFTGSDALFPGVLVRASSSGQFSGYACYAERNNEGNPYSASIWRLNFGTSDFQRLAFTTAITWAATDSVECEAVGSTITLFKNGISQISANDSAFSSGRVGVTLSVYGSTIGNLHLDDFSGGGFTSTAPTLPAITSLTVDANGLNITYTGSLASVRVFTELGSTIYLIGALPGGRLNRPWVPGESTVCVFARDAAGVENAVNYICAPTIIGNDTAPPILSNIFPIAFDFPVGTTTVQVNVTTDESATCRLSSTNQAYPDMPTTFSQTNGTAHAISLTGLSAGAYTRYIRCIDTSGNANTSSQTATWTILGVGGDTTPPTVPTNVAVTVLSQTQYKVSWTASTDLGGTGVAFYRIYNCTLDAGSYVCETFLDFAVGSPEIILLQLVAGFYAIAVDAVDNAGNASAKSAVATFIIAGAGDTVSPNGPSSLAAIAQAIPAVDVQWSRATDPQSVLPLSYIVERCLGASCVDFVSVTVTESDRFLDTAVAQGQTYRYRVFARDTQGNIGSYTTIVQVTIPTIPATTGSTGSGGCQCSISD